MIDQRGARDIAEAHIRELGYSAEWTLVDEYTEETKNAWVFFYDSIKALETGNFVDSLVGNGALHISKSEGTLTILGTALPWEEYLKPLGDEPLSR